MSTTESGASAGGVRSMTDAELDSVAGGIIPFVAAFVGGVLIGYGTVSMGLDIGTRLQTGTLGGGLHR